jgi:hypothetical protein
MPMSPKAQAFAFAASLVLVSTAMVGTSIATTGSVLKPFADGEDYAEERPLTRGHLVALSVVVREVDDEELEPVEGALVSVVRPGAADHPVATKATGEKGVAVFELKPGAYEIRVQHGEASAVEKVPVKDSMRVAVMFDGDRAHWTSADHRSMEKRGGTVQLAVKVAANTTEGWQPVEGAVVTVFRLNDEGERELVATGETGPRGAETFQLHRGRYVVNVSTAGYSGELEGVLRESTVVGVLIDGDEATWKAGKVSKESRGKDKREKDDGKDDDDDDRRPPRGSKGPGK